MDKKEFGTFCYLYPIPSVLMGAVVDGKPNYATYGNCGIISMEPCAIYVSSVQSHYTNKGVRESGVFSVNVPSAKQAVETDYCGIVSGKDVDKSSVFRSFYGKTGAPMIEECPVILECKLVKTVEIFGMDVFIGEVINCYVNSECLTNDSPDMMKIDPIIYDIGNVYRSFSGLNAPSFKIGEEYKPE